MVTIWKKFSDIIEEKLGVRKHKKLSDLEKHKHGKDIDWYDNGYSGIYHVKDNPTYTGVTEAIDRPVYDTVTITSASTTSADLFTTPQGQSSKTAMETSMRQAGILPSPEKFTIKRIGLQVQPNGIIADLRLVLQQVLFTFQVNSKTYTQAPVFYYPVGFGEFGSTAANAASVITNGIPGENGVRSLVYDIPLNPLDPFLGNLTMYGAGSAGSRAIGSLTLTTTPLPVVCFLQGPFERAI